MPNSEPKPIPGVANFAISASAFEGGLAILALILGWAFGIRPMATFHASWKALAWGILATIPPLTFFLLIFRLRWRPFLRIRRLIDRMVLPLFRTCNWLEIAIISFLAGLGEELLFRPIIQGGLAEALGSPYGSLFGLTIASIAFGLLHRITLTYAILAGAIGMYLGILWIETDNLLVPITVHALYDFLAVVILLQSNRPIAPETESIS